MTYFDLYYQSKKSGRQTARTEASKKREKNSNKLIKDISQQDLIRMAIT